MTCCFTHYTSFYIFLDLSVFQVTEEDRIAAEEVAKREKEKEELRAAAAAKKKEEQQKGGDHVVEDQEDRDVVDETDFVNDTDGKAEAHANKQAGTGNAQPSAKPSLVDQVFWGEDDEEKNDRDGVTADDILHEHNDMDLMAVDNPSILMNDEHAGRPEPESETAAEPASVSLIPGLNNAGRKPSKRPKFRSRNVKKRKQQ